MVQSLMKIKLEGTEYACMARQYLYGKIIKIVNKDPREVPDSMLLRDEGRHIEDMGLTDKFLSGFVIKCFNGQLRD